jgi:hypothetical protein
MRTLAKVLILSPATAFVAPAFLAPKGGRGGNGMAAPPQTSWRWAGAQPGQSGGFATGGRFANGGNDNWRHRQRYWPGAVYGFGYDDYNEPDVNQCVVCRKPYNARGVFVGWRQVNLCAG